MIYALATQPAFEYNAHTKKYTCMDDLRQLTMTSISSQLIRTDANEAILISLIPTPVCTSPLQTDTALVSLLGIRFHQQIGFKIYPLETGKAMGFVGVH